MIWIRRKVRKWVEVLPIKDWLALTQCDDEDFRKEECNHIYSEGVDFYDGKLMRESDAHFGDPIDCLAFAKRYQVVVVLYVSEVNIKQCCTFVFDGRPSHRLIRNFDGIRPNIMPVSSDVLELVRYRTDLTKIIGIWLF